MRVINYISRAKFYLKIAGLAGLSQVMMATVFKSMALLRISRSDCRFPFTLRFPSSDLPFAHFFSPKLFFKLLKNMIY